MEEEKGHWWCDFCGGPAMTYPLHSPKHAVPAPPTCQQCESIVCGDCIKNGRCGVSDCRKRLALMFPRLK